MLSPGADNASACSDPAQVVTAIREIAGVHFGCAEVFDVVEGGELGGDVCRRESKPEGFAGLLYAGSERVAGELFVGWEDRARLTVIKDQAAAFSLCGDECGGAAKGGKGEVDGDAEPREKGGGVWIKAGREQLRGEGLLLEIDGDEGK